MIRKQSILAIAAIGFFIAGCDERKQASSQPVPADSPYTCRAVDTTGTGCRRDGRWDHQAPPQTADVFPVHPRARSGGRPGLLFPVPAAPPAHQS